MWLQTCIVVSLLLHVLLALPDFRFRTDLKVKSLEKDAFAEYYLKEEQGFQPVEFVIKPDILNYFPKCCPPGFSYGIEQHNCVKDPSARFEYFELVFKNVNLIKTGMADCEVTVDHLVNPIHFDVDDDTRDVSFNDTFIEFGRYCVDLAPGLNNQTNYIVRECHNKDYCFSKTNHDVCIKKCCPDGYQYMSRQCTRNPRFGIDLHGFANIIESYRGAFAVYHQTTTCRKYISHNVNNFRISLEGTLLVEINKTSSKYGIGEEMYCIDGNAIDEQTTFPVFLLCTINESNDFKISRVVLLISCICLLLTVIVFIIIAKVRNLMGKIVTSYSTTIFVAFLLLLTVQFQPTMGDTFCKTIAYGIYFSFCATFTWMNVMCYEIWKTLGIMKSGIPIEEQRKVFLKYNIYAWSVPTILAFLAGVFNTFRILPDEIHPFLGETHCILENRLSQNLYGHTVFMVLPQAIMLSINGFLFVCTLRHFWKLKRTENEVQDSESTQIKRKKSKIQKYDIRRFAMATKLVLIMGLTWIFEVISSIIDFKQHPTLAVIEQVFDLFNCAQGVLMFCIFVLNKKTIQRLLRRCLSKRKEETDPKFSSITSSLCSVGEQEMIPQN